LATSTAVSSSASVAAGGAMPASKAASGSATAVGGAAGAESREGSAGAAPVDTATTSTSQVGPLKPGSHTQPPPVAPPSQLPFKHTETLQLEAGVNPGRQSQVLSFSSVPRS
jgi:hypothetical protein